MSYISAKKKPRNTLRTIFFVLLVLVLGIFYKQILSIVGIGTSTIASPVWNAEELVAGTLTKTTLSLNSKKSLISSFLDLQDDFMAMSAVRSQYLALQNENQDLREVLGLVRDFGYAHTARVVARPPQISYDTILIDKGSVDGLVEGQSVFAGENLLIGTIAEVHPHSSLVQLLSSSKVLTEARLISSELTLTLVGRGGGAFSVDVPRDVPIEDNDIFVSTQSGSVVIAEVVEITGDPQDPSKTVLAKSPINMNYLNYVFVKSR